jgi:hypothetical protein
MLDKAELSDRLAESLALFCVVNGVDQRAARAAYAGCSQLEAPNVEDVEGDVVPLARFAEEILGGDTTVIEDEGAGR